MADRCNTVKLYASQTDVVVEALRRDGVCYSKEAYVRRKYQESAPIFVTAYSWFVGKAREIVPCPAGAEYPYWAFRDLYSLDQSGGGNVLELSVPIDQAVFFDVMDWNKIMRLSYIGASEKEEEAFREEMRERGLNYNDVMLTQFYPEYKKQIMKSWDRLFRHHEEIKSGDCTGIHSVQAGLWQIREEWVDKIQKFN